MVGRSVLALALLVASAPLALAEPPTLLADQGPFGGAYYVDPIMYWSVAYTEPGTTDCYTQYYGSCMLHSPGGNAQLVHVEILGTGSVHFVLDDNARLVNLVKGTCTSTSPARTECLYNLPGPTWSSDFQLDVTNTTGDAGTVIYVALESGFHQGGFEI